MPRFMAHRHVETVEKRTLLCCKFQCGYCAQKYGWLHTSHFAFFYNLMLVSTKKLLLKANKGKYAVPAFNMNNLEILQGIVAGAEKMKSPVIIQTSEGAIEYAGMENLASLFYNAAKKTKIPMALHFDHGKNLKTVLLALKSGWYQSVMYDGSSLPYKENVANTKKVVKMAHARGVSVEAELGAIPGKEDNVDVHQREASYTNPHQALDL